MDGHLTLSGSCIPGIINTANIHTLQHVCFIAMRSPCYYSTSRKVTQLIVTVCKVSAFFDENTFRNIGLVVSGVFWHVYIINLTHRSGKTEATISQVSLCVLCFLANKEFILNINNNSNL